MTRSLCVLAAVSCLIGLAVSGCGGSSGASATTTTASSPTTTSSLPTALATIQRTRSRLRRCFLRTGGRVAVSSDRLLVVVSHNYVRIWVYPSPATARQVLRLARGYGIVPASLMGTDHTVFYQWKHRPSTTDTRTLSRCIHAAL